MAPKPQPKRRDNVSPDSPAEKRRSDDLPDDLRRRDQPRTPPDSLPPKVDDVPTLAIDGGNPNHPVHDDDLEDLEPSDFEEEVDALDAPNNDPGFDRAEEIAPLLDPKR
jgi:hypothetical protein